MCPGAKLHALPCWHCQAENPRTARRPEAEAYNPLLPGGLNSLDFPCPRADSAKLVLRALALPWHPNFDVRSRTGLPSTQASYRSCRLSAGCSRARQEPLASWIGALAFPPREAFQGLQDSCPPILQPPFLVLRTEKRQERWWRSAFLTAQPIPHPGAAAGAARGCRGQGGADPSINTHLTLSRRLPLGLGGMVLEPTA